MAEIIVIGQDECMGCEACVEICPSAFVFDEDEASVIEGAGANEDCVDGAIVSCPAGCISKES